MHAQTQAAGPSSPALLLVPGQVGRAVSSARVWFLDVGKAVQTPGSSRMTVPGPPWADRTLGGEPDVPTCTSVFCLMS